MSAFHRGFLQYNMYVLRLNLYTTEVTLNHKSLILELISVARSKLLSCARKRGAGTYLTNNHKNAIRALQFLQNSRPTFILPHGAQQF